MKAQHKTLIKYFLIMTVVFLLASAANKRYGQNVIRAVIYTSIQIGLTCWCIDTNENIRKKHLEEKG